jgi:glycosyltransferase involved in cell wall biosynthesis
MVSDFSPPYFGGMENHASEFFRHFGNSGRLKRFFAFFPAPNASLAMARRAHPFLSRAPQVEALSNGAILSPWELSEKILKNGLGEGIIFFNSLYMVRNFAALKSRFPGISLVLRSGGNDILQSAIEGKGERLADRQKYVVEEINRHVSLLIANSDYSLGRFKSLGILPEKIAVVRGGVDTERFSPAQSQLEKRAARRKLGLPGCSIILSAVRFVPFKAVGATIQAIEALSKTTGQKFILLLAGDGPQRNEVQRAIANAGMGEFVSQCNGIPFQQIHLYYRASDAYFQTPVEFVQEVAGGSYVHTETMGRSFCEAASCGLPSVSTCVGGVPEIIMDGKTGLLFPPGDLAMAAAALVRALGPEGREMGIAARQLAVSEFSWERVFGKYVSLFGGEI